MLTANIYILLRITNVDNFGVASHSGYDYENTSIWGSMAMVLRPFGPEWGRLLRVENFVFLGVHTYKNQLVRLTFINCKLGTDNFCNSNSIKLTLTNTKKMPDEHPHLTADVRTVVIGTVHLRVCQCHPLSFFTTLATRYRYAIYSTVSKDRQF